ncbi:NAD(P)H-hydrate dehydratase [Candidatus Contubernalis alkaliaceticus]|uniref:NAD(P)H-hydrate dehydratase n=1 Tax=Candidatus Contubernalis alkaliaceticus TaxID=338645 RepID=UPI001F4C3DD2|nr:NAD(P)H-hydrate dehydratase [Candidatus Contubernalis alkalaceticus]UNC91428.1 NAD(P)H-hydrate dehydratase [Candidatus Contubernalis alkalaceticus]
MKIVTAEKMREMDARAIKQYEIPGVVLMENAGLRVVEAIMEMGVAPGSRVVVVSGKGNNGGDGFVIARHLVNLGFEVPVFSFSSEEEYRGDARTNFMVLKNMGVNTIHIIEQEDLLFLERELLHAKLVVDALLGTGAVSQVRGLMREAIECLNQSGRKVISVDIPSGIHADTGEVLGRAVKAQKTVTFALPKQGLFLYPGAEYAGEVIVGAISIPEELMDDREVKVNLITQKMVQQLLPKRKPNSHKGTYGRVMILGGSPGFTGAVAMAGETALRSGSGLITVGVPVGLNPVLEAKLTEVMTYPLPETLDQGLSSKALDPVLTFLESCDAAGIGPGIYPDGEAFSLLAGILQGTPVPLVLDAGALTLLARDKYLLKECKQPLVLTPHPGEMATLLNRTVEDVEKGRLQAAGHFAQTWGVTIVLKGARTVVALPTGELFINITGNSGMASGGTGDVLTGLITSLIGQGLTPGDAAVVGVYLHGLAGDRRARVTGEAGLTAGDLINELPNTLNALLNLPEEIVDKLFYFNRDLR